MHDMATCLRVDVDNLHERGKPLLLCQHGSDGGVCGRQSVEEAQEPPQLPLPLLYRHTAHPPPLTHHCVTAEEGGGKERGGEGKTDENFTI